MLSAYPYNILFKSPNLWKIIGKNKIVKTTSRTTFCPQRRNQIHLTNIKMQQYLHDSKESKI